MSVSVGNAALPFFTAGVLILTLPGCESTGNYRVGSVGAQGPQGIQGPQGGQGPAGSDGSNGLGGAGGLDGANAVATGGLVGPGGVAGTGLLANTGDPAKPSAGSGVLVASGQTVSGAAQRGTPLAERVDGSAPGGLTITGRVVRAADNTGQALVRTGNGDEYLVDGLAAAPGTLVTVNTQDNRIVGRNGDRPLIAGSALAPNAPAGDALTVGAANNDRPVQVGTPATGTQQPAGTNVQGVLQGVTAPLGNLPRRGD